MVEEQICYVQQHAFPLPIQWNVLREGVIVILDHKKGVQLRETEQQNIIHLGSVGKKICFSSLITSFVVGTSIAKKQIGKRKAYKFDYFKFFLCDKECFREKRT
jgi:hypothetical protein